MKRTNSDSHNHSCDSGCGCARGYQTTSASVTCSGSSRTADNICGGNGREAGEGTTKIPTHVGGLGLYKCREFSDFLFCKD